MGQMIEDVRLAANGKNKIHFYKRTGGIIPTESGIYEKIKDILK